MRRICALIPSALGLIFMTTRPLVGQGMPFEALHIERSATVELAGTQEGCSLCWNPWAGSAGSVPGIWSTCTLGRVVRCREPLCGSHIGAVQWSRSGYLPSTSLPSGSST
jgi:hypothetical protein